MDEQSETGEAPERQEPQPLAQPRVRTHQGFGRSGAGAAGAAGQGAAATRAAVPAPTPSPEGSPQQSAVPEQPSARREEAGK
ncbi:hypothetical protein KDK95_26275 [Actinospica sp. MGRD01-02]|uniref:Uncharacterized protein n=1 Tax=Actinospica acidithermotolerans TaxID=2828514 RepID=A0A941EIR4_9ACTN|nr:hypothetical protein [Actinospica acidithermotolerans]MBR7829839.1 hypothetical protein [Actinospica acidithermotolerans]